MPIKVKKYCINTFYSHSLPTKFIKVWIIVFIPKHVYEFLELPVRKTLAKVSNTFSLLYFCLFQFKWGFSHAKIISILIDNYHRTIEPFTLGKFLMKR